MTTKNPPDFITLLFSGVHLNPDKISDCLNVEPISRSFANKPLESSSRKKLVAKKGGWAFSLCESSDYDVQLTRLTNYFRGKEKQLKKIAGWKSVEHAYIEIVIHPRPGYVTHSVLLNAEEARFWSAAGIDICCVFSTIWNDMSEQYDK